MFFTECEKANLQTRKNQWANPPFLLQCMFIPYCF